MTVVVEQDKYLKKGHLYIPLYTVVVSIIVGQINNPKNGDPREKT